MRALALSCLMLAGCYDVAELSNGYDAAVGDAGDAGASDLKNGLGVDAGGGWIELPMPVQSSLRGVFGDGTGELYAVGAPSVILRLSATHAPLQETVPPGFGLRAVWANGVSAITVGDEATALLRAGGDWTGSTMGDQTLLAVTGLSADESIAVGSSGNILHRLSATWAPEDSMVTVALRGVWARPLGDRVAVGEGGTVLRGSGSPTTWASETSGTSADLNAVWATANDTFVVGAGGVVLHAGATGAWGDESSGTTADLYGVFGAGDQVWAVGAGGVIVSRTTGAWQIERSGGPDLRAVWASGPSDVWAVGDSGRVLHRAP